MTATMKNRPTALRLLAETAADLMVSNPVSLRAGANVREALALLTDRSFSAAPVIDEGGRPVGVLSRSDLLIHDREFPHHAEAHRMPDGFQEEDVDPSTVRDLMTPAIFSVALDTPAAQVVSDMVSLGVHRLFVLDDDGTMVGVITSMDVLRHLLP